MNNIRDAFRGFARKSMFLLADENSFHNIFIGLDSYGRMSLLLTGTFDIKPVPSTICIDVSQYSSEGKSHIIFGLKNSFLEDMFFSFCDDIIRSIETVSIEEGYSHVRRRYRLWRSLFSIDTSSHLSESAMLGLLGELYFMKEYLSESIGLREALYSWSGSEKTKKDFSYNETWYEVKTHSSNPLYLSISSLEQLESDHLGFLAAIYFERMSKEYKGLSLNSLVNEIETSLDESDVEIFKMKLSMAGYDYSSEYDNFVYDHKNSTFYEVNEDFPLLTHSNTNEAIVEANYKIAVTFLKKFIREKI